MGFDVEMFVSLDDNYMCPCCMGVLCRPLIACAAGHSFCAECIAGLTTCPCCRGPTNAMTRTPNLLAQNVIDAALVRCGGGGLLSREEGGVHSQSDAVATCDSGVPGSGDRASLERCDWTGRLDCREAHLRSCPLVEVDCRFTGCGHRGLRRDLDEHEGSCPFREVKCTACEEMVPLNAMAQHERDTCGAAIAPCPHGCNERMARRLLSAHAVHSCPNYRLDCAFVKQGCNVRPIRRDYAKHQVEAAAEHARLAGVVEESLRHSLESAVSAHRAEQSRLAAELANARRELELARQRGGGASSSGGLANVASAAAGSAGGSLTFAMLTGAAANAAPATAPFRPYASTPSPAFRLVQSPAAAPSLADLRRPEGLAAQNQPLQLSGTRPPFSFQAPSSTPFEPRLFDFGAPRNMTPPFVFGATGSQVGLGRSIRRYRRPRRMLPTATVIALDEAPAAANE